MARVAIVFEDAEGGGITQSIERSRNDCQDEPTIAELFADAVWTDLVVFMEETQAKLAAGEGEVGGAAE